MNFSPKSTSIRTEFASKQEAGSVLSVLSEYITIFLEIIAFDIAGLP